MTSSVRFSLNKDSPQKKHFRNAMGGFIRTAMDDSVMVDEPESLFSSPFGEQCQQLRYEGTNEGEFQIGFDSRFGGPGRQRLNNPIDSRRSHQHRCRRPDKNAYNPPFNIPRSKPTNCPQHTVREADERRECLSQKAAYSARPRTKKLNKVNKNGSADNDGGKCCPCGGPDMPNNRPLIEICTPDNQGNATGSSVIYEHDIMCDNYIQTGSPYRYGHDYNEVTKFTYYCPERVAGQSLDEIRALESSGGFASCMYHWTGKTEDPTSLDGYESDLQGWKPPQRGKQYSWQDDGPCGSYIHHGDSEFSWEKWRDQHLGEPNSEKMRENINFYDYLFLKKAIDTISPLLHRLSKLTSNDCDNVEKQDILFTLNDNYEFYALNQKSTSQYIIRDDPSTYVRYDQTNENIAKILPVYNEIMERALDYLNICDISTLIDNRQQQNIERKIKTDIFNRNFFGLNI